MILIQTVEISLSKFGSVVVLEQQQKIFYYNPMVATSASAPPLPTGNSSRPLRDPSMSSRTLALQPILNTGSCHLKVETSTYVLHLTATPLPPCLPSPLPQIIS